MLKKKRLVKKSRSRSSSLKATEPFDGPVPKGDEWRDGLILVLPEDAPDDPNFPKLQKGCYPPETYYAFNPETMRTECMVSYDAYGVGISWDMDRSMRYFLRCVRPIACPRFVEYSYDASNALKAGEHWSHSHANYRGSLSGEAALGAQPDHRVAPRSKKKLGTRKATVTTGSSKTTKSLSKRPLSRPQTDEQPADDTLLHDKGKMDAAAADMSASLSQQFGKKPLKRKVRR